MTKHEELRKCLHGLTQNQNESFNNLIWMHAPKSNYCGLAKMEFAVYDALANFNGKMGITPDYLTTESCRTINLKRIKSSKSQTTQKWRKNCKIICAVKKT